VTPSVSSKGQPVASGDAKGLAETPAAVCTPVCTSEVKTQQGTSLDQLAAALLTLSPEDRAKLAAMLFGQQSSLGEGKGGVQ
jgi:hypothetical protein